MTVREMLYKMLDESGLEYVLVTQNENREVQFKSNGSISTTLYLANACKFTAEKLVKQQVTEWGMEPEKETL